MGRKDAKNWAKLGKIGQNWAKLGKKIVQKMPIRSEKWLFLAVFSRFLQTF